MEKEYKGTQKTCGGEEDEEETVVASKKEGEKREL